MNAKNILTIRALDSFVVPEGVVTMDVECWGGGGAGSAYASKTIDVVGRLVYYATVVALNSKTSEPDPWWQANPSDLNQKENIHIQRNNAGNSSFVNIRSFYNWQTGSGQSGTVFSERVIVGQYVSVPQEQTESMGNVASIPSMQGFLVKVKNEYPSGSLSINYAPVTGKNTTLHRMKPNQNKEKILVTRNLNKKFESAYLADLETNTVIDITNSSTKEVASNFSTSNISNTEKRFKIITQDTEKRVKIYNSSNINGQTSVYKMSGRYNSDPTSCCPHSRQCHRRTSFGVYIS